MGTLLKALDDLGLANDTIVIYTTDNGPHVSTRPDAATTPFRSEKNTDWEGAFRVPAFVRRPGHIKPDSVSNEIVSGLDWLPTLLAAAGDPDVRQKLLKGYTVGGTTCKVHLDDYNILPYLTGQEPRTPRREFFCFSDDCDLLALRYENCGGQDVRPAGRSLRARGHHLQHVPGLGAGSRLPRRPEPDLHREVHRHAQGVPAAPEAGDLRHSPGVGGPAEDGSGAVREIEP